ncbi:TetR family transcriptional regulator [Capsulimonas corticalis]|uniref:TetR family transcriptional regulator n=1 Tax=Capsulimonas corticalis TaxID=2219043 RepID=A0A402D4K6_9BACT|nr:TetR/AcrR family transcriptional regulator [Capsulimonas corticalis]BDI29258.1 TetR family transcriptional regulator [Capsulimonas corticalis]
MARKSSELGVEPTRKSVPRAGLDRDALVRAAVRLVDQEGVEALSLGRLAKDLGVRTPSLYNHVDGMPGLKRAIAIHGLRELHRRITQATIGREKDAAVLGLACAYREFAKSHPGLYAIAAATLDFEDPLLTSVQTEVVNSALLVLSGYHLSDADALHAVRGLRSAMHGFVTLELAGLFGMPLSIDESFDRLIATMTAGLSASE